MSPSALDSAEAQWQIQLAAMRAALADLKLPPKSDNEDLPYGSDIEFDEDDEGISGNSGDDVWDFISDSDNEIYSGDFSREDSPEPSSSGYGAQWLQKKCTELAGKRSGLSSDELSEQILALLASDSNEEELQSTLTDIIGFDDFDFLIELISHRREIVVGQSSTSKQTDGLFAGLQTRQQREEALRQRDFEHKNAALAPKVDRESVDYPHVYKAFSAGNTLDAKGRKYGVPVGTERTEHMVSILIKIFVSVC